MSFKYPSIYNYADNRSTLMQKIYFYTLFFEYLILVLTSVNSFLDYDNKYIISLIFFIILTLVFFTKIKFSLSSKWYKYRALAESIKTTTWRYIMKSEPFNNKDDLSLYKDYVKKLQHIVNGSNIIPKKIKIDKDNNNFYTISMKEINDLPFTERKNFYLEKRVKNQLSWYDSKSEYNLKMSKIWSKIILALYLIAVLSSIFNIFLNYVFIMPVTIITTIASSLIGWSQIKRYEELHSSYLLTAGEIRIIVKQADFVKNEDQLSDFVKDAELAFSREHTQWTARRS